MITLSIKRVTFSEEKQLLKGNCFYKKIIESENFLSTKITKNHDIIDSWSLILYKRPPDLWDLFYKKNQWFDCYDSVAILYKKGNSFISTFSQKKAITDPIAFLIKKITCFIKTTNDSKKLYYKKTND